MTGKQLAIEIINTLPEDIDLCEIAHKIEFIAGVKEGFEQVDRGEGVSVEEAKRQIQSWITE